MEVDRNQAMRQRYYGFPSHNLKAQEMLHQIVSFDMGALTQSVNNICQINDFELPPYLQDAYWSIPEKRSDTRLDPVYIDFTDPLNEQARKHGRIQATPLEAAVWLGHHDIVRAFQRDIEARLQDKASPPDKTWHDIMKHALDYTVYALTETAAATARIHEFHHKFVELYRKGRGFVPALLNEVGIYLHTTRPEMKRRPNSLFSAFRQATNEHYTPKPYWQAIPYILRDLGKPVMAQDRVLQELWVFYQVVAFYYMLRVQFQKSNIPEPPKFYDDNLDIRGTGHLHSTVNASMDDGWSHYVHDPETNQTFDAESGRELLGAPGQQWHDLRFDAHNNRFFDHEGNEVELVGISWKGVKKGVVRVVKGRKGAHPMRYYVLLLNNYMQSGKIGITTDKTSLPKQHVNLRPDYNMQTQIPKMYGTFTLELPRGKLAKARHALSRSKEPLDTKTSQEYNYPALLVLDDREGHRKLHVAAQAYLMGGRPAHYMVPTKDSTSTDALVRKFWKATYATRNAFSTDRAWSQHLREQFANIFGGADARRGIQSTIQDATEEDELCCADKPAYLVSTPFDLVDSNEDEEDEALPVASSSVSTTEQF